MAQKTGVVYRTMDFPIVRKLKTTNYFIPSSFYEAVQEYCRRNTITIDVVSYGKVKRVKKICLQCLKAFILSEANNYYNSFKIMELANKIEGEIGHSNYYIDQGIVKSLDNFL